jgi:hypothetical protein
VKSAFKSFLCQLALGLGVLCLGPGLARAETPPIKPLIRGLVSMEDAHCLNQASNLCAPDNSLFDAYAVPNILHGVVINVTWAQLEPAAGTFTLQPIEQALEAIKEYNRAYPRHALAAILRVESASVAPDWVKALDGGPATILFRTNGRTITVPYFWTADYQAAWRALQKQLAVIYDDNALIAQISDTSCSHETDEPYVNPTDSASIITLFNAGYTNQNYIDCLLGSIHDYDAWRRTRVDFTQNPFETLSVTTIGGVATGVNGPPDLTTTVAIMGAFRAALKERAIVSNHNLLNPPFKANVDLYKAIRTLGPPIEFQTASPGVNFVNAPPTGFLKHWNIAIDLGVALGATAIEVWRSSTFMGNPVNDGWNPIPCNADVRPDECSGQPIADLVKWNRELLSGREH